MRAFNHHDAHSVDEALALLSEYEGRARLIAGGTDLLPILKDDIFLDYPEALINIKTISGLDYIREDAEGLTIGALAKLSQIACSPEVESNYVILAEAAESAGTPELRNMGTIGGNLCQDNRCWYYRYPQQMGGRILCYCKGRYPCPAVKGDNRYNAILGVKGCFAVCPSDTAIALAALDADIIATGPDGEEVLSVIDLYDRLGHHVLRPDKIMTEIRVPRLPANAAQSFIKFRLRESVDFAIVSVATVITLEDGLCQDARIVLGAVAPMPFRAVAAEEALRGRPLDAPAIQEVAEAAVESARPLRDNEYKVEITKTLVKRALLSCLE